MLGHSRHLAPCMHDWCWIFFLLQNRVNVSCRLHRGRPALRSGWMHKLHVQVCCGHTLSIGKNNVEYSAFACLPSMRPTHINLWSKQPYESYELHKREPYLTIFIARNTQTTQHTIANKQWNNQIHTLSDGIHLVDSRLFFAWSRADW